jgi:hypothetical protein
MAEPFEFTPPEGPFLSFLRWLDRPGQAVMNAASGNFAAAGRQTADLFGEMPDAFLPGDMIPTQTRRGDETTASRALGIDEDTSPWVTTPVDFVGGILANPASYLGAAPAKLAASVGKSAMKFGDDIAPDLMQTARKKGGTLALKGKRALGYRTLDPQMEAFLQEGRATRKMSEAALSKEYERIFGGLDDAHQTALGDAFDNLAWGKDGKVAGLLDPTTALPAGSASTIDDQIARIQQRIAKLSTGNAALDAGKLSPKVKELVELNQRMWDEGVKGGVFKKVDDAPYGVADYLQRHFNFDDMDNLELDELASGIPTAVAKRKLGTDQELVDFLKDPTNAKVGYERNALKRSLKRAENQGRLLERAAVGKKVGGQEFILSEKGQRDLAVAKIDEMKKTDPELALALEDVFKGMPPRGAVNNLLAKANKYWKPYVVYGIFVPKIGSAVRNIIGGGFQVASTPDAAKDLGRFVSPKNLADVFGGAVDDGIERVLGSRMGGGSELTKSIQKVDQAFAKGGGTIEGVMRNIDDPDLRDAVRHGVLDGFVSSEEVGKKLLQSGILQKSPKWLKDWAVMPGDIFKGVEQRMRLGLYKSLVKEHGYTAERAAAAVRDSFYDYNVWNEANRKMRDVIPFAAFTTNAIRQQGKWVARNPAVGVAAAQLFQGADPDHPTPQWISEQASVRMGKDAEGNPQYAAGFGLPIEALNSIPGMSGRDWERGILSKTQPLLKGVYSAFSGRDPHFGTDAFNYDKTPELFQAMGAPEKGAVSKAYRTISGLGLNPLDPAVQVLSDLFDKKKTAGGRALDMLTGANVVSVDEQAELQRLLQRTLDDRDDVKKHTSLYQQGDDEVTAGLLAEYERVKKAVRERRKLLASGVD